MRTSIRKASTTNKVDILIKILEKLRQINAKTN